MSTPAILYIVPGRIQAKRLQILQLNARKHNYLIKETFSEDVTHVLTEFETVEQVQRYLQLDKFPENVLVVNCQWLIDSVKCGAPINDELLLKKYLKKPSEKRQQPSKTPRLDIEICPGYVCQRKCVLQHKNPRLVKSLEILVRYAEYRDEDLEHDYSRALAFSKAISVLKSIPFEVNKIEDIEHLPDIGPHSVKVIREIIETGRSEEVELKVNSDWYKSMLALNAVYGIGPVTAKKLYGMGLKTIEDLRENDSVSIKGEDRVAFGLAFYEDLNEGVTTDEVACMKRIIANHAHLIDPKIQIEMTGGFRRGKMTGHDIDYLFTHPEDGKELGFLHELLSKLNAERLILHSTYKAKSNEEKNSSKLTLDHFEQALLIVKLPGGESVDPHPAAVSYQLLRGLAVDPNRKWKAVRVDLVVAPISQYAFALLGWTGNKLFNRSIRNYAKKKANKRLTSHGLWDYSEQRHIAAFSEQQIFTILQLPYIEPFERNS